VVESEKLKCQGIAWEKLKCQGIAWSHECVEDLDNIEVISGQVCVIINQYNEMNARYCC